MSEKTSPLERCIENSRSQELLSASLRGSLVIIWIFDEKIRDSSGDDPDNAGDSLVKFVLVRRIITSSWIYRWLTREPNPNVIVIDLRETRTVGPVIPYIDRMLTAVSVATVESGSVQAIRRIRKTPVKFAGMTVATIGIIGIILTTLEGLSTVRLTLLGSITLVGILAIDDTRPWNEIGESKTIRTMRLIFEPPEPSARASHTESHDETESEEPDPEQQCDEKSG